MSKGAIVKGSIDNQKTEKIKKDSVANKKLGNYFDYNLLIIVIFLVSFGLVILYSASAFSARRMFGDDMHFFSRQAIISVVSIVIMLVITRFDYRLYSKFAFFIYGFSLLLMVLVQTPLGVEAYGARRWLPILGTEYTFQPSQFTKLAVIVFISYIICRYGKRAFTMKGALKIFAYGTVAAAAVFVLTEDLSTAIVVMSITVGLYFVVHPKYKWFVIAALAAIVVVIAGLQFIGNNLDVSENFRMVRIITWLDPEAHPETGGFQILQSLYAIGSGGFWGRGLGNGTQKLGIIPEIHNDMILAVIAEELGVFGVLILLLLFGMLLYRLMFIAQNAPNLFCSLLVTGIFIQIAVQVILNIAVVTNLVPTTGITLPFISFGGTSILFLMAKIGIALGVSRQIVIEDEEVFDNKST